MCHRFSRWGWLLLGLLLSSCSSYAPPDGFAGMSREQLIERMGPPEMERRVPAGSRLEFPRGPFGTQTWFIDLDAAGRASRADQVLTEANFLRIEPGMLQDDVRRLLGRPSAVQQLGRERGVVWSYRYDNYMCQWFQIEITLQQRVRSAGYAVAPECEDRADHASMRR